MNTRSNGRVQDTRHDSAPPLGPIAYRFEDILSRIEMLNEIGIALSAQPEPGKLLEIILQGAQQITRADGATLYLVKEQKELHFECMKNTSLGIAYRDGDDGIVPLQSIPLYDADGRPDLSMVSTYVAHKGATVNIADAYQVEGFDFSGTVEFDRRSGYMSRSFLTVPMKNHDAEMIGVLQLINRNDPDSGAIVPFSAEDQQLAESLASQAAIALTNHQLIKELRLLFERFIEVIALAVDEKSPYTGGHCRRVPQLTMMIADAFNAPGGGASVERCFSEADLYELKIAALVHDCGKITTPVHIVDKATRLEAIFDRINLIDTRFEVLKRDAEIDLLKRRLDSLQRGDESTAAELERRFLEEIRAIDEDRDFLRSCNKGDRIIDEPAESRIRRIANRTWRDPSGNNASLMTDDEVENICITRGTLTAEQRQIINRHIVTTITMLEALPFPNYLRRVPHIAGSHHERIDGNGYPRGLTGDEMLLQAKILALADIFEALTAADRPYKDGMKLSQAMAIIKRMVEERHLDAGVYRVFVEQQVYRDYARNFLAPAQIDEIDPAELLRFSDPVAESGASGGCAK